MTRSTSDPDLADYEIHGFSASDREPFLELYGSVFGTRPTAAWFDWKYRRNPFADSISIAVAERDGDLVGARSFMPLVLATPRGSVDAVQPCDTMVHPDHRRRGLFTRMTRFALERYGVDGPAVAFNFPNEATLAGNLDLGWTLVENLHVAHRVQAPSALLASVPLPLARPLDAATTTWLRLSTGLRAPGSAGVTVERRAGVPADLLADIADPPSVAFHVPRDARFYAWRYARPDREYETYLARTDGRVEGAAVVSGGEDGARIMEFVPRTDRRAAVTAGLLGAVLRRHADAALVSAVAGDVDPSLMSSFGFANAETPLIGRRFGTRPFAVRPFDPEGIDWVLDGVDLRDPEHWLVSFGDLDVG